MCASNTHSSPRRNARCTAGCAARSCALSSCASASATQKTRALRSPTRGWIGTKAEVEAEYERNKAIGLATGCWKGGILVENDHGDAMKAIRERDEREAAEGVAPPGKRTKHN